jgi:protein gp37
VSTATKIEWTRGDDGSAGVTWNPVTGCTEVSEGCGMPRWEGDLPGGCYAKTFAERWRGIPGHPFEQGFDVRLWPGRLREPLRWRKPKRVFVNSMSDLFIGPEHVPDEFIAAVWTAMFWTSAEGRPGAFPPGPQHTYQILTKRPGRMRSWVRRWGDRDQRVAWIEAAAGRGWCDRQDVREAPSMPAVLPNVWLGVSAETQRWAQVRLPLLAQTAAVVRFASCEPLLGPLDLRTWLGKGLDWVIAGENPGLGHAPCIRPGSGRSGSSATTLMCRFSSSFSAPTPPSASLPRSNS